ncbi:MAG: AI-2E family transporter [Spirochaetes bacterium RBG_13_68_11]|nr:MAG: AI-2E family transporter [Spirochaetes bacterium RBG_13_68_11]
MTSKQPHLPLYVKATVIFIGALALLTMMYIGRAIIVPFVFAVIFAIVLHPVVRFLIRRKIPRVIAIIVTLFLAFLVLAACGVLLYSQARRFAESWPMLVERFTTVLDQSIAWVSARFNVQARNIRAWIAKAQGELVNTSGGAIGQMLVTIGNGVTVALLVPVYMFMILFYQPLILEFIRRIFSVGHQGQVSQMVTQAKTVIQRYLVGLVIEVVIMATLNSVALLILGIDYAILLGVIGSLLNLIPLIGGIVAVVLPIMIALATKPSAWYVLYVIAAFSFIQLVDNNFIIPKIVASKVKINALFSILVVIAGNALWGIPGMFLSIPLLAMVKLLFDNIEPLKPWGFLLGDTMPRMTVLAPILSTIRKKVPFAKLQRKPGRDR